MKSYAEIKAQRQVKQLSNKALVPCGECHNCGWRVPPRAHWCSTACAQVTARVRWAWSMKSRRKWRSS